MTGLIHFSVTKMCIDVDCTHQYLTPHRAASRPNKVCSGQFIGIGIVWPFDFLTCCLQKACEVATGNGFAKPGHCTDAAGSLDVTDDDLFCWEDEFAVNELDTPINEPQSAGQVSRGGIGTFTLFAALQVWLDEMWPSLLLSRPYWQLPSCMSSRFSALLPVLPRSRRRMSSRQSIWVIISVCCSPWRQCPVASH